MGRQLETALDDLSRALSLDAAVRASDLTYKAESSFRAALESRQLTAFLWSPHQLGIVRGEDPVPDALGAERFDDLADLLAARRDQDRPRSHWGAASPHDLMSPEEPTPPRRTPHPLSAR